MAELIFNFAYKVLSSQKEQIGSRTRLTWGWYGERGKRVRCQELLQTRHTPFLGKAICLLQIHASGAGYLRGTVGIKPICSFSCLTWGATQGSGGSVSLFCRRKRMPVGRLRSPMVMADGWPASPQQPLKSRSQIAQGLIRNDPFVSPKALLPRPSAP